MAVALPNDERARLFAISAGRAIPRADAARLQQIVTEGEALLAAPQLDAITRARVHLAISGAYGQLAKLGHSQINNGSAAFRNVARAYALAPQYDQAVLAYARTISAFGDRRWHERTAIEMKLGISIAAEGRRVTAALAAFPRNALAQLVRQKLATRLDDTAARQEAEVALARLSPATVASARRELGMDAELAKSAKPQ